MMKAGAAGPSIVDGGCPLPPCRSVFPDPPSRSLSLLLPSIWISPTEKGADESVGSFSWRSPPPTIWLSEVKRLAGGIMPFFFRYFGYRRFTPLGFVVPLPLVFAGLVVGDLSTIMDDGDADLRRKARSGRRDGMSFSCSVFGSMALCGVEECRGVSFFSGVGSSCCFWAVGVGSVRLFTLLYFSTGVGSGLLLDLSQCIVACFVVPHGRSLGLWLSSTPTGVFFIVPSGTFKSLTLLVSNQDNTRRALSHDDTSLGVDSITVSVVVSLTLITFHHIV